MPVFGFWTMLLPLFGLWRCCCRGDMLLRSPRVLLTQVAVDQPHHIGLVLLDLLKNEALVEKSQVFLEIELLRHLGRVHPGPEAVLVALVLLLPLAGWGGTKS